jgi:hypothetical protein
MTSTSLSCHAEKFRSAVDAHDYPLSQRALQEYVICFRSCSRTLPEVEDARNLLQWGVQATIARKAGLAEELMLLKSVFDAYGRPRRFHTWHLEA